MPEVKRDDPPMIPEIELLPNPDTGGLIPEEWRDIDGYEGIYEVSNYGRVKSLERLDYNKNGRPLPIKERIRLSHSNGMGHQKVCLSKSGKKGKFYVHRLVAVAFIGNPMGLPLINHIDRNPMNNYVDNIEWVSVRENVAHGLKKKNSRKKTSKYPGVHFDKSNETKVWKCILFANGVHNYLGNFYTEKEAFEVYKAAMKDYGIVNKYIQEAV